MDTKIPTRFFKNLLMLGLSNKAIIQEYNSIKNHQFLDEDLNYILTQLSPLQNYPAINDSLHLMNIRCIIYYGRIRIPRWTSIEMLNCFQILKDLGPDNQKYTIEFYQYGVV